MRAHELAGRMVQTGLEPELLPPDVHKMVTDAMQNGLAAVVVTPVWVKRVATMLQGSGLRAGATVGFPHGTNKSTVKAIEATSCVKDGADELWVVPHLPNLIRADLDATKFELLEIVRAARATRRDVLIHVVVEWVLMQTGGDVAVTAACRAIRESGCDGVVTSTGVIAGGSVGPETKDIKEHAQGLIVTAHGWIDERSEAIKLLEAGADRVASERAAEMVVESDGPRTDDASG